MTEEMPSLMRQYAALEHIPNSLRQFVKANPLLSDKSEAVGERHRCKMFKALKPWRWLFWCTLIMLGTF